MSVHLSITHQTRAKVNLTWLTRQLRRILNHLDLQRGEWTVTLVGDRAMAALHQRTMNLPRTTDVLTFDLRDPQPRTRAAELELDTVLCVDEARRRAREMKHELREELLLYALHSLLHVRGYDDVTAPGAARMHRREDHILLTLGVGAVYAGATQPIARRTVAKPRRRATPRKKAS